MAWYEQPYIHGKPLPVAGFPRPLYPPDAKDKTPSEPGPDIEAYKRVVWRAQRWPGPASNFDRVFSNGFSHGKSSNVGETGVAGVQRQQGLEDTGFIGKATFEEFRRILVPDGPNKGQHAMDANAQNLIALAYKLYQGSEPKPPLPSPPARTTRQRALAAAITHLGDTEVPRDSNRTKYGKWYGQDGQPWCAMFCTYCYEVESGGSPSFVQGRNYAYVPYVVSDARNNRNGLSVTGSPVPGDLVCYDWNRDSTYDHIGIFEGWVAYNQTTFTAIEGNTGPSNYSNGGMVMRCTRQTTGQGTVFVRVAEKT